MAKPKDVPFLPYLSLVLFCTAFLYLSGAGIQYRYDEQGRPPVMSASVGGTILKPNMDERPQKTTTVPLPVIGVLRPLRAVPDSLNNFRATSITEVELRTALALGTIKKVMNLSGDIPGKMSMATMQAICQEYQVEYLTSGTLQRFAARSGYQEGRGFVRSAEAAAVHLRTGNVLVVDRSGNRAGALIGYYLITHHAFTLDQVIRHNNWEVFAQSPGKSYQYLETVTGAVKMIKQ